MGLSLKSRQHAIALLFLIITVIFWGISFISTKYLLADNLTPIGIAFLRQCIATIALLVWLGATKAFTRISLRDIGFIALSALFGTVLYFWFENTGLVYTSASNASMIVAAVPVFTLLSEALFFKLKITLRMVLCILLSIAGVYLVISDNGKLDFSSGTLKGNLLVIGAMVSWVAYCIINRKLSGRHSTLVITSYQSVASLFLYIPFIAPELHKWKIPSTNSILHLIYLGVCCSALAYFFFIYASKRLGPTITSAFLNLIPVVTVAAVFILGEIPTLVQILGMGLIMFSLFKLSSKGKKVPTSVQEIGLS